MEALVNVGQLRTSLNLVEETFAAAMELCQNRTRFELPTVWGCLTAMAACLYHVNV